MASKSSVVFCLVLLVASCLVKIEDAASTECRRIGHGCFDGKEAVFQGRHNRRCLLVVVAMASKRKRTRRLVRVGSCCRMKKLTIVGSFETLVPHW